MRAASAPIADRANAAVLEPRGGVLSSRQIQAMAEAGQIRLAAPLAHGQIQPASLDLRLGPKAYRVRASFLPGKRRGVDELLAALKYDEMSLEGAGAVLERGCFYVVPLLESLALGDAVLGAANPKSSTGRLDIFTRLITDRGDRFDEVAPGYHGPLYAEVSPRSFSVRVRTGTRLNQLRFRTHAQSESQAGRSATQRSPNCIAHRRSSTGRSTCATASCCASRSTRRRSGEIIGYRAQKHTDVIDVDRIGAYRIDDYWDRLPSRDGRLILDPGDFYILASHERLAIPPDLAAEMAPMDAAIGEFRVHYAGFFDPGFGAGPDGRPGARAVLEVRSREVPFILEDGQFIGRLVYERMAETPQALYGQSGVSNYQGQGLKLSKHFMAE